ncbi:MAG: hypothetical protein RML56_12375 [Burkholderiales bacterium]|nr:hypothetical protein [Burkholderiales bacterium]
MCLETYWADRQARIFRDRSVRPFFEGLAAQFDPPIAIAHRYLDTPAQLAVYTRRPDGVLWRDPEAFDAPVFYLSFHGSPGRIHTALARIGPKALCRAFAGWGRGYDNLVYFAACSVLAGRRGERFAEAFLRASGSRAVLGYATDVNWMDSMLTDLLFLRRFYADPDPWENLGAIYASVCTDFAPARALGFVLRERPRSRGRRR